MKKILIITIIFLSLFFIADYKIQAQTSCSKDSLEISFDENKIFTASGCLNTSNEVHDYYLIMDCFINPSDQTIISLDANSHFSLTKPIITNCQNEVGAVVGIFEDKNSNGWLDQDELIQTTYRGISFPISEPVDQDADQEAEDKKDLKPKTGTTGNNNSNDSDITQTGPTKETFDLLNPLKQLSSGEAKDDFFADGAVTPANIINRVMKFLFPIAGMILFVMLIWGGFEILGQAATKKSMDAGRQRITAAIGGFFLLFISYWLMQLVEVIFGVKIL